MHVTVELSNILNERNVTLYEFCKVAGISYQQGLDITKKRTKGISFEVLEKVCLYLNCSLNELIVFEGDTDGYIQNLLKDFPETDNVKRIPQSKESDKPKPFLQWVGGKREMIKQYDKFIPKSFSKYWEPFLGGGALFFHLNPKTAAIGDNNPELIKTYEAIRDKPEEVIDLLLQLKRKHSKDLYMSVRSIDRKFSILKHLRDYEIAARMIYLNQTCFNGVYRVNKQGQFNVPIGSSLNRVICDPKSIRKASSTLRNVELYCLDFEKILLESTKDDFVYLDPPYFPISQYSDFTRFTKEKFFQRDQERLKVTFDSLHNKGSKVMLSNSNSDFIKKLYKSYNIHTVYSGRTLNVAKDKRGKISELVITNY